MKKNLKAHTIVVGGLKMREPVPLQVRTDKPHHDEQREALMLELYKLMFTVAYRITRNQNDAMDIVQDSWVKILEKLDTLRDPDKLRCWVKVIVSNTAINRVKKESFRRDPQRLAEASASYITTGFEDIVLNKVIRDSLESLDALTRQMFVMKYDLGLKDKEIADMLDMPLGTVKARLFRGREKLRHMLTELYVPPT
jgi:RNA polymerase sigma-70 factor, ECF subfamily